MTTELYIRELRGLVQSALKRLLCEKHLYQSTKVDISSLDNVTKSIKADVSRAEPSTHSSRISYAVDQQVEEGLKSCLNAPWMFSGRFSAASVGIVEIELPPINTFCTTCETLPPFNPLPFQSLFDHENMKSHDQWYTLAYQCQQCRGTPVYFLVRREGLKLSLVGRDPIEAIPAPKELPEPHGKYYGKAIMAYNTGQTLAGIFFLRTFIEQFWRSNPAVKVVIKEKPRATGDEQGAAYQATLPDDFKGRFPSLSQIYGDLSAAMHDANGDAALFEGCRDKILHHFEGRKAFRL